MNMHEKSESNGIYVFMSQETQSQWGLWHFHLKPQLPYIFQLHKSPKTSKTALVLAFYAPFMIKFGLK